MKKYYLNIIILIILFGCKKEPIVNTNNGEIETIKINKVIIRLYKNKSFIDFYNFKNNQTVWKSKKNRDTILETIRNCDIEGLNPDDYNIQRLLKLERKIDDLDEKELIHYDLALTYNFQKYLAHLHNGKLNPKKLYHNWDLKIKKLDTKTVLINALENNSLSNEIKNCQPKALTYQKLIKALSIINQLPNDKTDSINSSEKIEPFTSNPSIITLKQKLMYWGDLNKTDSISPYFNTKTIDAVKKFQVRHGIKPDGVINKNTITALNLTKEERKHQIIANLERWRWFSRPFAQNYVLINIPDFNLSVVENQSKVMTKKIITGKADRKTPVLTSILQTIVFNPTWTVPPTILKEDILPEFIKNRNSLKNKNIAIYDYKNRKVDPLKWNEKRPNGYRYVQEPGYYNSLGVVKINFPNHHSVYLHDTNHRNLFDRNDRSLSSGCVRIQTPLELVELLLDNPKQFSKAKIDSIIATKKTLFIGIKKRYAIYLWYWTAWSENNKLIFRNDIYNLDAGLYNQLRN